MAVIVAEFAEPVAGRNGLNCRARACALSTRRGDWHGWIEFNPTNGAPTFISPRETEQPTRHAIAVWADGLTPPALEEALDRALTRIGMTPVTSKG